MVASRFKREYTLDDYLAVEEMSAVRHEYLEGEILATAGGTPEHAALAVILARQLDKECRPYSADLRIRPRRGDRSRDLRRRVGHLR